MRQIEENTKRINILVNAEHHDRVLEEGLNFSGLVRSLLSDHFSGSKVTLGFSEETCRSYHQTYSKFGGQDREFEPFFLEALEKYLASKEKEIGKAIKDLNRKKQSL